MILVVCIREYDWILVCEEICVSDTPSWGLIEFSDNLSDVECARHLTMGGVTSDELANANQYAFSWLQTTQEHKKDVQMCIAINQLLDIPWGDNITWLDSMSYHYSTTYTRWMPTLAAAPLASSKILIGTSSLQPPISEVVPPVIMVTDNPFMLSDENVNMDVPTATPVDHVEDDNMADVSGPSGPL